MTDFSDTGAYWLREYESDTIKEDFDLLFETLAPLYKQIHAYARSKLRNVYGDQFSLDGLIPAHLLGNLKLKLFHLVGSNEFLGAGNVFASSLDGVYSLLILYPKRASIDVTNELKAQVSQKLPSLESLGTL